MKKILSIIECLVGISAVVGGYNLIATDGMHLPKVWLSHSIFSTYFWPGVILFTIVGGTYLVAAITMWRGSKYYRELSAVAGFGLMIWVFTELYLLPLKSFLQVLYFGIGLATVVVTILIFRNSQQQ